MNCTLSALLTIVCGWVASQNIDRPIGIYLIAITCVSFSVLVLDCLEARKGRRHVNLSRITPRLLRRRVR